MSRKTRKLIWSAPLVAVLAVAGALAMFAAQGTGNVFANPLPAAPMNLEVEAADGDAGRTTLVLSWDAAANASGYRIDKADGLGVVWETMVTADDPHMRTTYTDDTLTADDSRWYRVFAVNSHGVGPVSNRASGTTDKKVNPGSVMNLQAVPNPNKPYTQIDLSWDPPNEDGGEKIVGYEVQFHNGSNWGNLANATVAFTASVAGTTDQVTLTTKVKITDAPPTASKLDAGDKRLYRVRAINGPTEVEDTQSSATATAALGSRSKEWARIEGMTKAATDPGQVTGLTAVNTGAAEISLYWYDPADTGGWNISGYVIQAHRSGKKFPSPPTIAAIEAATFGTTAPTLGGADTAANPDNATWYQTKSTTGSNTQAVFPGIVGRGTTPVQQLWTFRVYAVTTDDGPDDAAGNDDVFRRSASASNSASDTPAERDINHDNDDGTTPALDPLAPLSALTATTSSTKKKQIDLSTTVSTALSGATPPVEQFAYRIDYSEDAGLSWKLLEADTSTTDFSEDRIYEDNEGLEYDESRSYRFLAIGSSSTDLGPSSPLATGTTQASVHPKAPTGVMASSPSLTSIMASWAAPKDNGGQPITKYLVQWVKDDGDDVAEDSDFTTNTDTSIDDDATDDAMAMGTFDIAAADALDADTVYVFRVAGVNKLGTDERPDGVGDTTNVPNWSDPVLFSTADAAKPNMVEGLTSERATDASGTSTGVNLLWNKPSDKIAIDNYDIEVQDEEGDWANPKDGEDSSKNRTLYTDPDEPEMDEMRRYRVRASNGAGHGEWAYVYYPREPITHTHVAAMGTIPAQEVTVGMETTVDATMYFSDNTGATYAAESDMEQYATVMADASTGMVTITGVAEGTATITVTATSGAVEAEQEFMVTVMAAGLGKPASVEAMVVNESSTGEPLPTPGVTVTWMDGENADVHWVHLLDLSDWSKLRSERIPGNPSPMTHTFLNVASGTYLAIVESTLGEDYDYAYKAVVVE